MEEFESEFAWLIERAFIQDDGSKGMGPLYYTVAIGQLSYWTTDPHSALRFSRKKDAEDFIHTFSLVSAEAIEHAWIRPTKAPEFINIEVKI
jgi:hypothetical protein